MVRPWLGLVILALAVALGAYLRVHTAFATGLFDGSAEGLLRADPGTLWYLLQCFVAGGGWPDTSFAADTHVEHPSVVDCWSTFTVGHEFVLAGLHGALPSVPLHRLCVITLAVSMSLCAVGIYVLTRVLTGRILPAAVAVLLLALTPAAYRTIGFVLMNEDTSLPLFAAHLGVVAHAVGKGSRGAAIAAACLAVLAAATWHASTLLLTIEFGCALLWTAWSGRALLPRASAVAFLVTVSVLSLLVPALRAKGFAFGMPVQLGLAAALVGVVGSRAARWARLALAAAGAVALAGAGYLTGLLWTTGSGDFRHVLELLLAKIVHFGRFPDDPAILSFDARIMWQGPFASMPLADLLGVLGIASLPAGLWLASLVPTRWWRRADEHNAAANVLAPLLLASVMAALLVNRMQVLPALLVPVAAALWLARFEHRRALALVGVLLLVQAWCANRFFATLDLSWHQRVPRLETRAAVEAVIDLTEPNAAIAADPVLGGAILAHTGRKIAVQAKWETEASRTRMRLLLEPFLQGTVADLHQVLTDELRCQYFLVDRQTLWGECRQMGGIPRTQELPAPGTAAAAFCSDDLRELMQIPGFQLLYRTPSSIRYDDGTPSENVRLFRVVP